MEKMISLNDLSKKFKVNKSTLHFYYTKGLIKPMGECGKLLVFDDEKTTKTIKRILELKKENFYLKDIKEQLKNENL